MRRLCRRDAAGTSGRVRATSLDYPLLDGEGTINAALLDVESIALAGTQVLTTRRAGGAQPHGVGALPYLAMLTSEAQKDRVAWRPSNLNPWRCKHRMATMQSLSRGAVDPRSI